MQPLKLFTLAEARALLPELRQLLEAAKNDLESWQFKLSKTNANFVASGEKLLSAGSPVGQEQIQKLRTLRAEYQNSIEELSSVQQSYIDRVEYWINKITQKGVMLRDLEAGLLDFPCQQDDFNFLLCWKLDEPDIGFWHLSHDGYVGRQPLSTLSKYC